MCVCFITDWVLNTERKDNKKIFFSFFSIQIKEAVTETTVGKDGSIQQAHLYVFILKGKIRNLRQNSIMTTTYQV